MLILLEICFSGKILMFKKKSKIGENVKNVKNRQFYKNHEKGYFSSKLTKSPNV